MKILITTLAMTSLLLAEMTLEEATEMSPEDKNVYIISNGDLNKEGQENLTTFAKSHGINIRYNNKGLTADEKKEVSKANKYYEEKYGKGWLKKLKKSARNKKLITKENLLTNKNIYTIITTGRPYLNGQKNTVNFAKKFGVNIRYKNSGCIGNEKVKLSKETEKADKYYEKKYGKDWLKKLLRAANQEMKNQSKREEKKKEEKEEEKERNKKVRMH